MSWISDDHKHLKTITIIISIYAPLIVMMMSISNRDLSRRLSLFARGEVGEKCFTITQLRYVVQYSCCTTMMQLSSLRAYRLAYKITIANVMYRRAVGYRKQHENNRTDIREGKVIQKKKNRKKMAVSTTQLYWSTDKSVLAYVLLL
jgi:hypothetical protein